MIKTITFSIKHVVIYTIRYLRITLRCQNIIFDYENVTSSPYDNVLFLSITILSRCIFCTNETILGFKDFLINIISDFFLANLSFLSFYCILKTKSKLLMIKIFYLPWFSFYLQILFEVTKIHHIMLINYMYKFFSPVLVQNFVLTKNFNVNTIVWKTNVYDFTIFYMNWGNQEYM